MISALQLCELSDCMQYGPDKVLAVVFIHKCQWVICNCLTLVDHFLHYRYNPIHDVSHKNSEMGQKKEKPFKEIVY